MPSWEGAQGHRRHKGPAPQEGLRVTRRRAGVAGGRDTLAGVVPANANPGHKQNRPTYWDLSNLYPWWPRSLSWKFKRPVCQRKSAGRSGIWPEQAARPQANLSGRLKRCRVTPAIRSAAFARNFGCPSAVSRGPIPRVFGAGGYAPSELSWNSSSASCSASALFLAGSSCGSGRQGLIS